jgi:uncharacterized protein
MIARTGDLPDPGERGVPRYSGRPFPAYRYVPGIHPHPIRHPSGHSYEPMPALNRHAPWSVEEWRELDTWLFGVDLFNWFYFWEAHEAWEGLWAAVERESPAGLMLQGLIQIAAALLKTHMGVVLGARSLSTEGLNNLHRAAMIHAGLLGLDLNAVRHGFQRFFAPLERNELPVIGPDVPVLRLRSE